MGKCLWDMEVGERGIVEEIGCGSGLKRRLMELGFVKGGEVICVGRSPLGDPRAYWIRGIVLALRKTEGKHIWVEEN